MSTALQIAQSSDIMWDPAGFAHSEKLAAMFAASQLVPEGLRGKKADVHIALLMAHRLGEDALVVMQNIHFVKGKAGWNAQYIIARANRSGIFKNRLNWRIEAGPSIECIHRWKDGGNWKSEKLMVPDLRVTCFARLAESDEEVSFTVSMAMAKAEGWTDNEKYFSLPELMLRYRAATFLVRLYAPDVMLGIPTTDEIEDITIVVDEPETPAVTAAKGKNKKNLGINTEQHRAIDVDPVPVTNFEAEKERLAERETVTAAAAEATPARSQPTTAAPDLDEDDDAPPL